MRRAVLIIMLFIVTVGQADAQQHIFINELLAANVTGLADEAGDRDDWIEFYNAGSSAVQLAGYFLTDDPAKPRKWMFPSTGSLLPTQGYLVVWADEQPEQGPLHASFKLSRTGEWIALVSPDGQTIIDSLTFDEQQPDISFGRTPDGGPTFITMTTPTPGYANPAGVLGSAQMPTSSLASGIYASAQQVNLTAAEANASIYYTLDGSTPTPDQLGTSTMLYDAPFTIDATVVIRARTFSPNYLPSPVIVIDVFINPQHHFPIISIVTEPVNFFGEVAGIYTHPNDDGREWERACRIFYYENGSLKFNVPAGIRLQGNTGRLMDKKSFRLFFRNNYGVSELEYPLFDRTDVQSFESLVLRAGYDDDLQKETGTLVRDPLVTELYRRLGFPVSHSRYVSLYLNERFWGVYDLREDVNSAFVKEYFGIADMDVIRLRWGKDNWEVDYGDGDSWRAFIDFVRNNSFESDAMFEQLARQLDVENFTTVLAVAHAAQYRSWTYGSFFIRERLPDARWQMTIWDMDRSLTDLHWNGFDYYANTGGEYWINFIVYKMLENDGYRRYFINRVADLLSTTFRSDAAVGTLDSLVQYLSPEIPRELARWSAANDHWAGNVEFLRHFLTVRPDTVFQEMEDYFGLERGVHIRLDAQAERGSLRLNSVILEQLPFSGQYYPGVPIDVTALPKAGFTFSGWDNPLFPGTPMLTLDPAEGLSLKAFFSPLNEVVVINEIMYSADENWNCGDWLEFYNPGDAPINISGWTIRDGASAHQYMIPPGVVVPAKGYLVVARNLADFINSYHDVPSVIGDLSFGLSAKDGVRIYNYAGELVDEVAYTSKTPWPMAPSEQAVTLALIDPSSDNALAGSWGVGIDRGSPGAANRITHVEQQDDQQAFGKLVLSQNYPNPFNAQTLITFEMPRAAFVTLTVYDLRGRMTAELVAERLSVGSHAVSWSAENLPSGIYFVRLQSESLTAVRKIVLQK